jgi:phage terminase large subunit GpA-like protein
MTSSADALIQGWSQAAETPTALTVSQWADEKRRLPKTSAARGGRWQTNRTPYLRGIMDAIHEPGVKKIATMKGSQIGGSEALHNILGYHIDHSPCPMLLVHPSDGVAEQWSKDRLDDIVQSTPSLRRAINKAKSTLTYKEYKDGFLVVGGANTPNTFARWSVLLAMGDDVDRWPAVVGEEGDPADLLINRLETFDDGVAIYVSTPTLKDGRIDTLYQRSDQRRYFVSCPHCRREDWITWNAPAHFRVAFDNADASTARIECPECQAHLNEAARRSMIAGGDWRPTATAKEHGLVGFHLPTMLSTFTAVTLESLVEKWLDAHGKGKDSIRVFINTKLAEGWEDRTARIDPQSFMSRREDYGEGVEVPAAAVALTCGVDVQGNRFELQVIAWGAADERWVIDYRVIDGSPKIPDTWTLVLQALGRKYRHASGVDLPIHITFIDSGHEADAVYDFVLKYQTRRIHCSKGYGGKSGNPIVGKPSPPRGSRRVPLYPVNVDDAKRNVISSLDMKVPGPSYSHFPLHVDAVDEEYFAMLVAEHEEVVRNKRGVATHTVWVEDRPRNEALDTAVLCLAGFRKLRPNIPQMLAALADMAKSPRRSTPPDLDGSSSAAPPRPGRRRFTPSGYLNR